MRTIARAGVLLAALALVAQAPQGAAETLEPLPLWPDTPPGDTRHFGEEHDTTKPGDNLIAGKRLIRLANVSAPTLQVYQPPAGSATGAAVIVCPGGAYHILAMDLEGTEVCEWLNSIGVTGILLKYRVPRREGREKHEAPLQDAQRALRLARHRAADWGIDPNRIGVLGFSAGGHLAAALSTRPERTYPKIDDADVEMSRPNFSVLVYPGYLTIQENNDKVAEELHVSAETPPTFMVMTQDDPVRVANVLHYALALDAAKVPIELHIYPTGGHGYGLRRTENPVTAWPDRVADWLKAGGWLKAR
jgi:acetyl esterase/lipase